MGRQYRAYFAYCVLQNCTTCTITRTCTKLVRLVQPCASLYANYANYSYRAALYKLYKLLLHSTMYKLVLRTRTSCTCTRLYVQACILACTRRIVQVLYKALYNHKQACTTTSKLGEVTRSKRTNVC